MGFSLLLSSTLSFPAIAFSQHLFFDKDKGEAPQIPGKPCLPSSPACFVLQQEARLIASERCQQANAPLSADSSKPSKALPMAMDSVQMLFPTFG